MGHEAHHHVAQSRSFGSLYFCHIVVLNAAHTAQRKAVDELKASKFLSFHILVASLVFNRSPKRQRGRKGGEGDRRGR